MRTRSMRFGSTSLVGFLAAVFVAASPARAGFVELQTGFSTEGIGSATAMLSYSFNGLFGTLTVELANTTSGFGDDGGFITDFFFRIDGLATASLFSAPNQDWADTGAVKMKPFGTFEAGASIMGNPMQSGIDVNTPGTFVFRVMGMGASSLTEFSFFTGDGLTGDGFAEVQMGVKIRGIGPDDLSDKAALVIPLPAAFPLALAGLVGVVVLRRVKKSVFFF